MSGSDDSHSQEFNEQAAAGATSNERFEESARDIGTAGQAPGEYAYEKDGRTLVEKEQPVPTYEMPGPLGEAVRRQTYNSRLANEWMEHKQSEPTAAQEKTMQQEFTEKASLSEDKIQQNAKDMGFAWSRQWNPEEEAERRSSKGWFSRDEDTDRDGTDIER